MTLLPATAQSAAIGTRSFPKLFETVMPRTLLIQLKIVWNSIIGGATLWVLQGQTPEEYKGVADFFSYLSSPEVQADWHQFSGYLPITQAAYELGQSQGYYEKNPGSDVAIKQITLNPPTENSKGLRFGNYVQVRDVIDQEFQELLAGSKTPQEALDAVVSRGNELLREFQSANG